MGAGISYSTLKQRKLRNPEGGKEQKAEGESDPPLPAGQIPAGKN
jgi:hypothetical protein